MDIKNKKNAAASSVCRVDKKNNYTVMSNQHLRSPHLSLKAIGLLSKVLSLPEGWDYSVAGLTSICKEGKPAVMSALDELKEWGYLEVTKLTPDKTKSGRIEYVYTFYEHSDKDILGENITDSNICFCTDKEQSAGATYQDNCKQGIENLTPEFQTAEVQLTDNIIQSNTDNKINNNKILSNKLSIHQSVGSNTAVEKSSDRSMDGYSAELEVYTELVKMNVDFDDLVDWLGEEEEAEEIVQMIVRQICSRKLTECICGQEYPREIVKSALLKVNICILEDAIETVYHSENVRNFEKYLISTLFNAVNTQRFKEDSEAKFADYAFNRDFGGCGV